MASLKEDPLRVLGLYPKLLPDPCLGRWKYPYGIQTLAGPVLDNAFRALGSYLQRVRAERAEAVAAAVAADAPIPEEYNACADLPDVILDTALLRALLKIEHPFLAELAAAPNRCHIGVCEAALLQAKRYRPLVALYRGRGLHTKALELLNKLGHESSTGDMYGVGPTVKYLQGLGNTQLPLLLEYSVWVLHEDEDAGLSIFTAPRERPEALNAAAVLKHLDKHAVGAVADYLEHLINVQGETEPAFHNELIFTYLRSIQVILRNPASGAARPPQKAAAEIGLLGVIRKKLLLFLEASTHYKAEKMLSRFPTQDLYEERAVLLSRIGRHDQALAIYAHRLEDTAMAEAYAERHYTSGDARDVYLTLLDVYLSVRACPAGQGPGCAHTSAGDAQAHADRRVEPFEPLPPSHRRDSRAGQVAALAARSRAGALLQQRGGGQRTEAARQPPAARAAQGRGAVGQGAVAPRARTQDCHHREARVPCVPTPHRPRRHVRCLSRRQSAALCV